MPRTPAELALIRVANRKALGMSGMPAASVALADATLARAMGIRPSVALAVRQLPTVRAFAKPRGAGDLPRGASGLIGQAVQSVTLQTSFPDLSLEYSPNSTTPVDATTGQPAGPSYATWYNDHLARPVVTIQSPAGPVTLRAYDQSAADYSGTAKLVTAASVVLTVGSVLWILYRAFFPGARSNPPRRQAAARPRFAVGRQTRRAA